MSDTTVYLQRKEKSRHDKDVTVGDLTVPFLLLALFCFSNVMSGTTQCFCYFKLSKVLLFRNLFMVMATPSFERTFGSGKS